ncbi:MAG: hypothetical protein A2Y86_04105 [Candidatus Aminicenantes bacterium RBG_13_62_12]|nr:MAG: hypothetical protein A2Y86_04105 [Candidatus Aminicenantes bacterium RBG_13_62_12]
MNSCWFHGLIDDYLLNRLGENEKMRLEEHFFNCRACFEEVKTREELLRVIKNRGAEIFVQSPEPGAEKAPTFGRSAALRLRPWWALAALAAVGGLFLFLFLPNRPGRSPVFTLGENEAVRGETLELISPLDEAASVPRFFEWKPLSRNVRYVLFLYGQELIWSGETDEGRIAFPEEISRQLRPGQMYSWEVKAYSPPGTLITASRRAEFRLAED